MRQGTQLDLEGKGTESRALFQKEIDTATTPAAKANAQRAMAMSWAFEGNCKKTAEYEDTGHRVLENTGKRGPGQRLLSGRRNGERGGAGLHR